MTKMYLLFAFGHCIFFPTVVKYNIWIGLKKSSIFKYLYDHMQDVLPMINHTANISCSDDNRLPVSSVVEIRFDSC